MKPHAGPVFHAINYLFGRQTREKMEGLRQFGGVQPYPSRVKDGPRSISPPARSGSASR